MRRLFSRGFALLLTAISALVFLGASMHAQAAPQGAPKNDVWSGAFTSEQAASGKASYDGVCARCHGAQLMGGTDGGPALKGGNFLGHWNGDTLASLYIKIRDTMPRDTPGTVSDDVKIEILAFLLQQNGFPTGRANLKLDLAALDEVQLLRKGIWDGVFTDAQVQRGKTFASQGRCTGCHGTELGGTDRAPALKGPSFLANWEDGPLNRLFTKIRDGMPPANTDQLSPSAKIDIIAFLLRENGFPTGSTELTADTGTLDGIQIAKKGSDNGMAPNFALVQVVGCLVIDKEGWMLTDATEPVVTRDDAPTAAALKNAETKPLGRQTLHLVSVTASLKPDSMNGAKVEARGLIYRDVTYADLNLTSIALIAPRCR